MPRTRLAVFRGAHYILYLQSQVYAEAFRGSGSVGWLPSSRQGRPWMDGVRMEIEVRPEDLGRIVAGARA